MRKRPSKMYMIAVFYPFNIEICLQSFIWLLF